MKRNRKASWPRGLLSYDGKSGRAVLEVIVPGADARGRIGTRRRRQTIVLEQFLDVEAAIVAFRAEVRREFPEAPWPETTSGGAAAITLATETQAVPTFAAYIAEYRASILSHYEAGTSRNTRSSILDRHLIPTFGPKRLDAITDADVLDFVGAMKTKRREKEKRYSGAFINTACALFGRFLRDAVRRRVLVTFPLREPIPRLEENRPENELRDDERQRFVNAFDDFAGFQTWLDRSQPKGKARQGTNAQFGGKRLCGSGMRPDSAAARRYFDRFRASRLLFIVAMETGIRRDDLRRMTWRAVRFDEGVIRFRMRKTKKLVEIPMSTRCRVALELARERSSIDAVFVTPTGKPYDISSIRRYFRIAKAIAGITRPFRIHDIRHTFASRLVSRGENLKVVSELLGHRSIKMTERYARLSPHAKQSVVARLDDESRT